MFTVRTSVRPSAIHGNGVFAEQRVASGETVWKFEPTFDRVICEKDVASCPQAFRDFLDMYAYRSSDMDGALILSCDNARYLNHSDDPNTEEQPFLSRACRTIEVGHEITCDYGAFCSDGLGFDRAPSTVKPSPNSLRPHHHLYTRIKTACAGVGVFAIRDIPKGVDPFAGDVGEVVSVPMADVQAIEDEEVRRMYRDFCPVADYSFIAPKAFNQMTIGWYVNHSKSPNILVLPDMRFVAARRILQGEELTTDYTTYSESADKLSADWSSGPAKRR